MALVMARPYQATEGLLELLFEELLEADTYERLYQDTNSLRNYLVGTPEINQALTEVVSRLVNVTKKAKEVKGNIDSNQALKEAYSSLAAAIQSIFYGGAVASGSAFALCQGAAMGGIVVGSVVEITAGVVALGGAARLLHRPQP
ncbi:hypothetical protein FRC04_012109 [Tulasnella sp. 424]|nr:hypothetical protein FRC04_012109 [Tulasnella sp. 424]KAG8971080.1 hypothetical protein FRC05_011546 [Tulasnella sp. 425]